MTALISISDLQLHLQQTTTFSEAVTAAANADIEDASAAVLAYCERTEAPWTALTVPAGVALVVKRIAGRLLANPQQRSSYSGPDGLTYTGGPVRLLTDDEREQLDPYKASKVRVGSMRLGVASWMRPPTEAEIAAEAAL